MSTKIDPSTKTGSEDTNLALSDQNNEYKIVPTRCYIVKGISGICKKMLVRLIEAYVEWFAQQADLENSEIKSGRFLRPYFIIALILKKCPELSWFVLSHIVDVEKFVFKKTLLRDKNKITFLDMILRTNFCLFPGFCLIQETICSNIGLFIAVQYEEGGQIELLHETLVQLFLEEILRIIEEDLVQFDQNFI